MADTVTTIEEYFRINIEKKLLIHLPEEDEHQLTTGTRLLEIRRQMQEVDQGLASQKEEYSNKMESIDQRRTDLQMRQNQLKESLEKFDKFLKENDAKRTRALKKSVEEKKIKEQKEIELNKIKDAMGQIGSKRETQVTIMNRDIRYQQFLEYVIETAQDFDEIKDLVGRYETLVATYHDLMQRATTSQEKMEQERSKLLGLSEHNSNILLGYNNELGKLQLLLEEKQKYTSHCQNKLDVTLNVATQKSLLLGQIRMVTNNLFNLIKNHRKIQISVTTDTVSQLKKIQQTILDFMEIVDDLKSKTSPTTPSIAGTEGTTRTLIQQHAVPTSTKDGPSPHQRVGGAGGGGEKSVAGSSSASSSTSQYLNSLSAVAQVSPPAHPANGSQTNVKSEVVISQDLGVVGGQGASKESLGGSQEPDQ